MSNNFTDAQYKVYEKFHFFISNDDIFDSVKAHFDLKEWIKNNNITPGMESAMSKRMEAECKDGNSTCDLQSLTDVEYISYKAMVGELTSIEIIAYMEVNKMEKLTLHNGLTINKTNLNNYYVVDFVNDGVNDSIGLDLFLLLNKQHYGSLFSTTKAGN